MSSAETLPNLSFPRDIAFPSVKVAAQPWIVSRNFDALWILLPPFLALAWIQFAVPTNWWVGTTAFFMQLVLFNAIDAGHVFSTLYITYFDKQEFLHRRILFCAVPALTWLIGFVVHIYVGIIPFWSILAYLAIFHFLRQQYGFMRVYSRKEQVGRYSRWIDKIFIQVAIAYPYIYWHAHPSRPGSVFVRGHFFQIPYIETINEWFLPIVILFACLYVGKELHRLWSGTFNWPKNLVVLGSLLVWYVGIIYYFDWPPAFTVTQIITHGVPYYGLVWAYGNRKWSGTVPEQRAWVARFFEPRFLPLYIGLMWIFGLGLYGFWDQMIFGTHYLKIPFFGIAPQVKTPYLLDAVEAFWAVPQVTHYVLDGFIWKMRSRQANPALASESPRAIFV